MSHIERRGAGGGTAAERVLGGTLTGVAVRLLVMSFFVGIVLRVLDVNVNDVMGWLDTRFRWLSGIGIHSFAELGQVIAVGAVIVIPVWLLLRVVKILSR